jgi:hypothetical protein
MTDERLSLKERMNIVECPICEYWEILQEEKVCSKCVEKLKDFAITAGMRFDHEGTTD